MKTAKISGNLPSLIRGELAAAETYGQALRKLVASQARSGEDPRAAELRRIQEEHGEAIHALRDKLAELGGKPPKSSGLRGIWSRAVEGVSVALGEDAAIRALKEGEEQGASDYEEALADQALDSGAKRLILTELLPRTRAHVPALDRLLRRSAR
ncbi:MAG TPA: DUF2383 domain-containing protein [Elusimicrobiota bacterium]|jgi:hypothetical protein|nr:DUF2383 domain-containing protein [Elusimicrobiota bacterium]